MPIDKNAEEEDLREGRPRAYTDFDCPSCNANNPVEMPLRDGDEMFCNYCGAEYNGDVCLWPVSSTETGKALTVSQATINQVTASDSDFVGSGTYAQTIKGMSRDDYVPDEEDDEETAAAGLSTGAIVGIVLGVVALVLIAVVIVCVVVRRSSWKDILAAPHPVSHTSRRSNAGSRKGSVLGVRPESHSHHSRSLSRNPSNSLLDRGHVKSTTPTPVIIRSPLAAPSFV